MAFISLLIITPLFMAFGLFALFLLAAPFCVGAFLQLVFSIVAKGDFVVWIPAGLGMLGLVASLVWLLELLSVPAILIYWGVYFLCMWLIWLAVSKIKKWLAGKFVG